MARDIREAEQDRRASMKTALWLALLASYSMATQMIASALQHWSYWPLIVLPMIAGLIAMMGYMQKMRFPSKP